MVVRDAKLEDADALARVMIEAMVRAFTGRVPERCLQWITHEESATNWRKTLSPGGLRPGACLRVAEDSQGDVIGFALGSLVDGDPQYRGEIRNMAISPSHQRRGIGRTLVQSVAAHLAEHDVTAVIVRVLMVNPNRAFYERLGAKFLREEPYDWNGVHLSMGVYGWEDTRPSLCSRTV